MMKYIFTLMMLVSVTAVADHRGFITLGQGKEIFVDFVSPKKNQPVIVLINGLTYSTLQYDSLVRPLLGRGFGVLRFDPEGMGQTLLKYVPFFAPYPYQKQVSDLRKILEILKIEPPVNLAGLSYGGAIAAAFAMAYPEDVQNLIMIAPYTQPLESQDNWIQSQIWATRQTFPHNPASDDELYDYFLRQIVYATYPQAEPIVLENPFKLEATYNLIRGIRKFRPVDEATKLPNGKVHLMVSGADQYIPAKVLKNFWDKVPVPAKMSRITVANVEHKMNEVAPAFVAAWIAEIVTGNKLLFEGRDFEGDTLRGVAKSGNRMIKLGKE